MNDKKDIVDRLMLKPPLHNLTSCELVEAANEIKRLRKERDEARRIAAYQYAKHSNYGDESFAMKNFFQFHKWEYLKEDGK